MTPLWRLARIHGPSNGNSNPSLYYSSYQILSTSSSNVVRVRFKMRLEKKDKRKKDPWPL